MSELQDVLRAIEDGRARGERMALATVVRVTGSTYRREGARLLVPAEGRPVGTISGGCLEGEVREAAAQVMQEGRPKLLHFDLTADDEVVWGWGLGCNGVVDVFVEPAEGAFESAGAIRRAVEDQRDLVTVTVIATGGDSATGVADGDGSFPRPGARILVQPDGATEGSVGQAGLDRAAAGEALKALRD